MGNRATMHCLEAQEERVTEDSLEREQSLPQDRSCVVWDPEFSLLCCSQVMCISWSTTLQLCDPLQ